MKPLLFFFVTLLCLLTTTLAQPITGHVTLSKNGATTNASNQKVLLKIFNQTKQIAASATATDQTGTYTFEVEDNPQWAFQVSVLFDDTAFDSGFFAFPTTQVQDIVVAPTTGDTKHIKITEIVFLEFGSSDLVKVSHQVEMRNTGTTAYHPKKKDAQFPYIDLINGGFNLSLVEGITRRDIRINEDTHTMYLEMMLLPQEEKSFRFSYMYPLDGKAIDFKRATTDQYKSLHIISNNNKTKISPHDAKQIDIPVSLGSTFKKAYEVDISKPSLSFSIKGVTTRKNQIRNIALYLSIILGIGMVGLMFLVPVRREKPTAQSLRNMIADLQKIENPSEDELAKIIVLQRRLYHQLYTSSS